MGTFTLAFFSVPLACDFSLEPLSGFSGFYAHLEFVLRFGYIERLSIDYLASAF
jgi:hypothetical protein